MMLWLVSLALGSNPDQGKPPVSKGPQESQNMSERSKAKARHLD